MQKTEKHDKWTFNKKKQFAYNCFTEYLKWSLSDIA